MANKSLDEREKFVLVLILMSLIFSGISIAIGNLNQEDSPQELTFKEIRSGIDLPIDSYFSALITSSTEFEGNWTYLFPTEEPSSINFNENSAIVLALGERSTGGYSIIINNFSIVEDKLIINAIEMSPGKSCFVSQAFTSPYTIIEINSKPSSLEVHWQIEKRDCD